MYMLYRYYWYNNGLTALILAIALILPNTSFADDTEIYLGQDTGGGVEHNVLFVLDTSGSMKRRVGGSAGPTRISILKDVLDNLIGTLSNLKVGYMRMNGSRFVGRQNAGSFSGTHCVPPTVLSEYTANDPSGVPWNVQGYETDPSRRTPNQNNTCYVPVGGSVMFPVTSLDAPLLGSGIRNAISIPVNSDANDVWQSVGGTVINVDSATLPIGSTQCPSATLTTSVLLTNRMDDTLRESTAGFVYSLQSFRLGRHLAMLRFQNVAVPQNANILHASITFRYLISRTDNAETDITAVTNSALASVVRGTNNAISNSARTAEVVPWGGLSAAQINTLIETPDLSALVQEIVNDTGWNGNDAIGFVFSGIPSGGFHVVSVGTTAAAGPTLDITYCLSTTQNTNTLVGLRFEDVRIPQGAVIDSANIAFTAAQPNLNVGTFSSDGVNIAAIISDDAPAFNPTTTNLVTLPTVAVNANNLWSAQTMGAWAFENSQVTNDIKDQVQAITDRLAWCGGNAMGFILSQPLSSSNVSRRALSFGSDSSNAAILRVEYEESYTDASDTACNVRTAVVPTIGNTDEVRQLAGGTVRRFGSSIELGYAGSATIEPDYRGFIFSLPLASSTTVVSAMLDFVTTIDSVNVSQLPRPFIINAQASDNAPDFVFANNSSDLAPTARPRISGTGIPSGGIRWDLPNDPNHTGTEIRLRTDITPLVQAVVNRTGWEADNQMALIIENDTSHPYSGQPEGRLVFSFNGDPRRSPRLRLVFQEDRLSSTVFRVRDRLIDLNNSFIVGNLLAWTPSVETLFEAALYWRGKAVQFGRRRGAARLGNLPNLPSRRVGFNNPGGPSFLLNNVDYRFDMGRTLTSHPNSWTGGTYNNGLSSSRDCQQSHDRVCAQDYIAGNPTYISPIQTSNSCASNFQIFMTDGIPTWVNDATVDMITAEFDGFSSCSVDPAVNIRGAKGRCAVEMINDLANNDQLPDIDGIQTVNTYTIAFNLTDASATQWLQQLATAGRGNFYSANSGSELTAVFDTIIGDIIQRSSSFAAPAISANAFNRLFSRDEIYFGLFEANKTPKWDGNLKKYNLCVVTDIDADGQADCTLGEVTDASGMSAIDPSGLFSNNATSEWSDSRDGRILREGGAGDENPPVGIRLIYTERNNADIEGTDLELPGYKIFNLTYDPTRSHIYTAVCGTANDPSDLTPDSECYNRVRWMLGYDARDEDSDGSTDDRRWWFADILHSSPVAVTYGIDVGNPSNPNDDEFIDKIFVGSNDGALHSINSSTGHEEWAYIPTDLLVSQQVLYDSSASSNLVNSTAEGGHVYGLDSTPVISVIDNDNDGIIEPDMSDSVQLYIGMRRGGRDYYALGVTPVFTLTRTETIINPDFLWRIQGGSSTSLGNFSRLAQTWSRPVVADIACTTSGVLGATPLCSNNRIRVLIFGGGYDADALDGGSFGFQNNQPNLGNALYIVDANSSRVILWFSHAANTSSELTTATSGADIEVPNMNYSVMASPTVLDANGDGVFERIYFGDAGGQVWRVDLGADIAPDANSSETRRGSTAIGRLAAISTSGTASAQRRFHYSPAVVQVTDTAYSNAANGEYDYVVISSGDRANPLNLSAEDRLYAFRDQHIAILKADSNGLAIDYPLNIAQNSPITESDMQDVTTQALQSGNVSASTAHGWYFRFTGSGQKGLAEPSIIAGSVLTTSYLPGSPDSVQPDNICGAIEGTGIAHNFNILNAAATLDWDGDGDIDADDHSQALHSGIPSSVIPIFTKEGVTLSVSTGGGFQNLGRAGNIPRYRTYWSEESALF